MFVILSLLNVNVYSSSFNDNGFRVIRLMQEDVWLDKYDWLTELLKNIEDDTKQNVFMCKNGEYDFFSESMEMITSSNPYQPYSTSSL